MNLNLKILAAVAVSIGISLGIAFFAVTPLISDIEGLRSQTITMQTVASKNADRILRVRQFRDFIKKESQNLEKTDNILVDGKMPLEFIHYLEDAAAASGVKVVFSPSVTRKEVEGEWPALGFQADISGNINGIFKFAKRIETSPYLVIIEGFNIVAGIEKTGGFQNKEAVVAGDNEGTAHILLKAYAKE